MEKPQISGNLTLNISLPLLYSNLERPVCTRQGPSNQLTDLTDLTGHFASELSTNLTCHGPLNTLLTGHMNRSLGIEDRSVITQALQMIAAKFASEIVDRFPDLLAEQIAIKNGTIQISAPVSAQYPRLGLSLTISQMNRRNSHHRPPKTTPPI
jgi:hypothetical protein